jgi:BetI-type transcriptional repressor, C-terminal
VEDCIWPFRDGVSWWRQASAIWMNAWITSLHDPSIADARAAEDRRWRRTLTAVVGKGRDEGSFQADVDPPTFVKTLFALLDGFLVQMVLEDRGVTKRFAHDQSFRFLSRELEFDPRPFMSARHRGRTTVDP